MCLDGDERKVKGGGIFCIQPVCCHHQKMHLLVLTSGNTHLALPVLWLSLGVFGSLWESLPRIGYMSGPKILQEDKTIYF